MAIVPRAMTSGELSQPPAVPTTDWVRDASRPLERLAPLIHELVAWDLIYRSASGTYQLREDVQRHLQERSAVSPSGPAQVFVGRKCDVCGTVTVTKLVNGSRICGVCSQASGLTSPPTAPVAPGPSTERRSTEDRSRRPWRTNRQAS